MLKHNMLIICAFALVLVGCGAGATNVSVSTTSGTCSGSSSNNSNASGTTSSGSSSTNSNGNVTNAPYCLAVTLTNSSSGQDFITNNNYPINNLSITVSGATNIQSPATNSTTMDPNNCNNSTLNAGSSCTFYLQLSGEAYPVTASETALINVSYTVQNQLFSGGSTQSSSFNAYEHTNVYVLEANPASSGSANVWQYNSSGLSNIGTVESFDTPLAASIDNSAYGFLYFGGNNGVYTYGDSNVSSSISSGGVGSGASNLVNSSSSLFVAGLNTNYGVWQYSLSGLSWQSSTPVYTSGTTFTNNINTSSASSVLYFVGSNIVYACNTPNNTSCSIEGIGGGISGTINTLGFISVTDANHTGLYAGTSAGAYVERGTGASSTNTWEATSPAISTAVTAMTSSSSNQLFIGDNSGRIWTVADTSTPRIITQLSGLSTSSAISAMVFDNYGNTLYYTSGGTLYSCVLGTNNSCTENNLGSVSGGGSIIGLYIGSSLSG